MLYIFYTRRFNNHSDIFGRLLSLVDSLVDQKLYEVLSSYGLCITLNLILTAINTVFLSIATCSSLAFNLLKNVSRSHISSRKETRYNSSHDAFCISRLASHLLHFTRRMSVSFGKICRTDDPSIAESRCDRR